MPADRLTPFSRFYPHYLAEHRDPTCRLLHYVGSWLVLAVLAAVIATGRWAGLWALPVIGYGFAWVGHFVFEKNRPATFRQPLYSLLGDWVLWWDITTGRQRLRGDAGAGAAR